MLENSRLKTSGDVVKSVARTLQTIEFFDETQKPANTIAIASALGYPPSSTAAILKSMVVMGYLTYDSKNRTYFPTDRVPLIGNWMNPTLYRGGSLLLLLNELANRTGFLALLASQNGDSAQYIQVITPPGVPRHVSLGTSRPLGRSGAGMTLLTTKTKDEIRRQFHRINGYRADGIEAVDIKRLQTNIEKIRVKGYFITSDTNQGHFGLIAKLLPVECTDRPLAIGLSAPCEALLSNENAISKILDEELEKYFGSFIKSNVPSCETGQRLTTLNY